MATILRFGPWDHGRPMTEDEFNDGDFQEGYRYELIDGSLYVSPSPNPPHDVALHFVYDCLRDYARRRPDVLNRVTTGARVFVPGVPRSTVPQPDVAAYRGYPVDRKWQVRWRDVSPVVVVEVLGGEDDEKDLIRNVALYLRVSSIQEYWLWDVREAPDRLNLQVRRRVHDRWEVLDYAADAVYSTPLLPDFEIPVAPE